VATPDVVVVDHHDSYTFNLVHLVAEVTGVLPSVVQHDQATLPDAASDFAVGREVLLAASRPVLGVCLGMQGLVTTYGGRVDRVPPGHGVTAVVRHDGDGLFAGVPDGFQAVRYHSLAALELPDCLRRTAVDEVSGVTMAVAHRDLPLVGVQFHPESVLSEHGAALVRNFLARS
jgi:anthranilate synthase component 2